METLFLLLNIISVLILIPAQLLPDNSGQVHNDTSKEDIDEGGGILSDTMTWALGALIPAAVIIVVLAVVFVYRRNSEQEPYTRPKSRARSSHSIHSSRSHNTETVVKPDKPINEKVFDAAVQDNTELNKRESRMSRPEIIAMRNESLEDTMQALARSQSQTSQMSVSPGNTRYDEDTTSYSAYTDSRRRSKSRRGSRSRSSRSRGGHRSRSSRSAPSHRSGRRSRSKHYSSSSSSDDERSRRKHRSRY